MAWIEKRFKDIENQIEKERVLTNNPDHSDNYEILQDALKNMNTLEKEYLELNRMWISDDCKQYAESQAISYSIKYIKKKLKTIKWIQSFADERCGGFGIVYQACSFDYYGEHNSIF